MSWDTSDSDDSFHRWIFHSSVHVIYTLHNYTFHMVVHSLLPVVVVVVLLELPTPQWRYSQHHVVAVAIES